MVGLNWLGTSGIATSLALLAMTDWSIWDCRVADASCNTNPYSVIASEWNERGNLHERMFTQVWPTSVLLVTSGIIRHTAGG